MNIKNFINRLKRSNPHNIPAYEAEMTHHMIMHDDVLGKILTILKQDDYYRTLEELPIINSLTAYDDIQLFPKLYDTTTIIERVTGEADFIKRQLRQPGMYPLPKTPLPSTSGFVMRPTPTFQPIAPDTSPKTVNIHHTNDPQSVETSPKSSLPCGQWTPMGSISTNSTPSQHTATCYCSQFGGVVVFVWFTISFAIVPEVSIALVVRVYPRIIQGLMFLSA